MSAQLLTVTFFPLGFVYLKGNTHLSTESANTGGPSARHCSWGPSGQSQYPQARLVLSCTEYVALVLHHWEILEGIALFLVCLPRKGKLESISKHPFTSRWSTLPLGIVVFIVKGKTQGDSSGWGLNAFLAEHALCVGLAVGFGDGASVSHLQYPQFVRDPGLP